MKRLALAALPLAAAIFWAACKKNDWVARLHAEPMYQRAEDMGQSPSCAALVPMEFGRTLPVPVRQEKGEFAVLFYPLVVSPGKAEVVTPEIAGWLFEDGNGDSCAKIGPNVAQTLGPAVKPGVAGSDYDRGEALFFADLGPAADAYWRDGEPSAEDKKVLAQFAQSFSIVAEPPLLSYYYQLNPDFWEWLSKETGQPFPHLAHAG